MAGDDDGATGEDSTDASGTVAPEDGGSSTSDGDETDPDTTAETSSTGTAPECGNGIVEPGEQCEGDEQGCIDCQLVCGFAEPVQLDLSAETVVARTNPPVAILDGSGDFAVTSSNGVHRVSASGDEAWVNTYSSTLDWTDAVATTGADALWVGWTIGADAPFVARLTRHSPDDGSELESIELVGMPSSSCADVVAAPEGDLYLSMSVDIDDMTSDAVVERRSGDGAEVVWSTHITIDPQPDGYAQVFAGNLGLADDGTMFVAGRMRSTATLSHPHVAKLANDGSLLWQRVLWDDAVESRAGMWNASPMPDGGVVVGVWRQYEIEATAVGAYPALVTRVIRLDADGEVVWDVDPTEQVEEGRVQVQTVRALPDGRTVVGGALVIEDVATAWLGYLDADGMLACTATRDGPSGLDIAIDWFFVDAEGDLMVQGFADDDEFNGGSLGEARFIAPVSPY